MTNSLYQINNAMNMIKEELIRDLSESVIEKNKERSPIIKNVSFSEKQMD